jgi:hypothetical protein
MRNYIFILQSFHNADVALLTKKKKKKLVEIVTSALWNENVISNITRFGCMLV